MSVLLDVLARSEKSDATKDTYSYCIRRWLAFAGDAPSAWTPVRVEQWRDQLRAAVGPATVNKHIYALRYVARRYEALGYGPDFARGAEGVRSPKGKKRKALTVQDVNSLLATCRARSPHDLRDRAIIYVGIRAGLRVSELVRLKWHQIDGPVATVPVKGGDDHAAVFDDATLGALADWGGWLVLSGYSQQTGHVFRGVSQELVSGHRKVTSTLSRQKIHEAIAARGKAAGIRRAVHPHLFRHTFISWALAAGVPPHRVMQQSGQSSLQTLAGYVTDLQAVDDPVAAYLPPLED